MGIALASDSTIATANAPYLRTSAHGTRARRRLAAIAGHLNHLTFCSQTPVPLLCKQEACRNDRGHRATVSLSTTLACAAGHAYAVQAGRAGRRHG